MTQLLTGPQWLRIAYGQIGTLETQGKGNNPTVVGYFEEAQHPEIKQDEVPWCAAFVGAMLKRAGVKPSGSLMARSYEAWGQPLTGPVLGAIAVKKRKGGGWVGHVGFVVAASKTRIWLLGGNQGDKVGIADFPRSEFTAFRWPANIPVEKGALPSSISSSQGQVKES